MCIKLFKKVKQIENTNNVEFQTQQLRFFSKLTQTKFKQFSYIEHNFYDTYKNKILKNIKFHFVKTLKNIFLHPRNVNFSFVLMFFLMVFKLSLIVCH